MKCVVCKGPAVIDIRRHNANFCAEHFTRFCRDQVAKAIADFDMIRPDDRVLVAVSGGKDSLAVWDLLVGLGYQDALPMGAGLGILRAAVDATVGAEVERHLLGIGHRYSAARRQ